MKRRLVGVLVALSMVLGGVVLTAAPASAMGTCQVVKTKHVVTKGCDAKKQICVYYTYQTVCGP